MRVLRSSLLIGVLILLSMPGGARADVTDPGVVAARELFYQGVDGDKRATREALRQFRQLQAARPNDPLIQAYIGACEVLMGRDASNDTTKLTNIDQAVRDLDAALASVALLESDGGSEEITASTIMETKLVVANAFIHIPSFNRNPYNRRQDGERLLRDLRDDPRLVFMSPGFRARVMVAVANMERLNQPAGNITPLLKRAHELDPQGRAGRRAQQMMAGEAE
jgi:hypothetical protein